MLIDAHCHLGWFIDPAAAAVEASKLDLVVYAMTVSPREFEHVSPLLAHAENVRVGVGMHPWYISDADLDQALELVRGSQWIGEVGLDFSPRRLEKTPTEKQLEAFGRICSTAKDDAVLSVHSVRAANAALDALERSGASGRCRCIFHWFSGSTPELWRAIHMGCWFSLGERSLATKRGREYAKLIPADRLLTETDYPPREGYEGSMTEVVEALNRAIDGIACSRGAEPEYIRQLVEINAKALLG